MNYKQTLQWLFEQLPMFQREGKAAYKANLNNSRALDQLFDHPHQNFPCVHIAGTNGKGSTAHYIASVLQENGYRVGLHCSPHYFDFRERIKINGEYVSENYVVDFIEKYRELDTDLRPSFFELTVLMAFSYFAEQKVDVAVIETGLGGRLDTTNIIQPILSVITNIGLDHTQFLGDTIPKIAVEKAGIIKKETPVVLGEMDEEAQEVIMTIAEDKNAPIYLSATSGWEQKPEYLRQNIATATEALRVLASLDYRIADDSISLGIENVAANTRFMGRWQVISENPITIADSAHNPAGISMAMQAVKKYEHKQLHIVFGMMKDKDADTVLNLLPRDAQYYFCQVDAPRALPANDLLEKAQTNGLSGQAFPKVTLAYERAQQSTQKEDLVLVIGSVFVVGELLSDMSSI